MKLIIVAAISENYVLGKDNDLVWSLPADIAHYHRTVKGHWAMMGRRTWESDFETLPTEQIIVVTRKKDYEDDSVLVAQTIEAAMELAQQRGIETLIVLGGGQIYKQVMPIADQLILTEVHVTTEGDTFFPIVKKEEWKITKKIFHPKDEENNYDFDVVYYERAND